MNIIKMRYSTTLIISVITAYLFLLPSVQAVPLYQSPGPNLTYGNVTHSQRIASGTSNPASPAADQSRGGDYAKTGGMLAIGGGVEYGNLDNIFELIDQSSASMEPSSPSDGDSDDGSDSDEPSDGVDLGDAVKDIISNNPDLEAALKKVAVKTVALGTALALIATEGYGKAFATVDAPLTLKTNVHGGTLSFNVNGSVTSKISGIADTLDRNKAYARSQLEAASQLASDATATDFELSSDLTLTVDPSNKKVRLKFKNDSLLITKAAKIQEYSVSYSQKVSEFNHGNLFLGVKPKYLRVGLTRIGIRFGDITDSEELFDNIKDADFRYDDELSLDIGAMWVSENYQFGGAITNINEPSFGFPSIDTSKVTDTKVLNLINRESTYVMERQLKLEAGYHSIDRKWTVNVGLDANAAADPMGDDYQWASVSAGYATHNWWIPGTRVGIHSNLAGSELTYVSAGVTLFKYVDLDVSSTLDTVELDGTELPRGFNVSLGVAASF